MIELKNVSVFQKSINAISSFIPEGNFRFSTNGLSFRAIDPSQIVLVNFAVPKSCFDKYELEPTFVGVDLVELNKIFSRALPNDKLVLDITDSEMLLRLEGEMSRSFRVSLIDVPDEEVSVPVTKFDAKITISAHILKEALKDAGLFGSSVVFRVKGNQFHIEARGSQGTLKAITKETTNIVSKSDSEIVSKYSLSFLQNMVKEADGNVVLEIKSDDPMKLSYKIGDAEIQFYLAHMIL